MRLNRFTALKVTTVLFILTAILAAGITFNLGMRFRRHYYGVKPGVTLAGIPLEGLLEKEVRNKVSQMAAVVDRAPRNARYDKRNKAIVAERRGSILDVEATVDAVMSALPGEQVAMEVIYLEPEITSDLFRSINKKIASFSTTGGGGGRTDNLYVSAKYMNGTILAPGDVFSFNAVTGPRTLARGYSMAPIVGGMGIGGGVCQVSTTIYNAALQAKLDIIERYPHSIRVGYVPEGRDASVTNYADFKFRNSTDRFIQIRSGAGGGHVWVQLWSQ